jgi:Cytochrome c
MSRTRKTLGYGLVGLFVLLSAGITFTVGWRPFIGPKARPLTSRRFEATPERLKRGEYLTEHVAGCMECHSPHDWSKRDAPVLEGMLGAGVIFPLVGLPGRIVASNLTPDPETGTGYWSDDQLARAIREGIGHDGRALFSLMPYGHFKDMSDEDLASVIVYERSLKPVRHPLPPTEIIFPVKYLIRSVPEPIDKPVPEPDQSNAVSRGQYLVEMASCITCHTPVDDKMQLLPGMDFSGGRVLEGPWGKVASANLTPDPSGIPHYSQEMFIKTIRTGAVNGVRQLNQVMPWHRLRGMTDDDLAAIFAYLRTLKPVRHRVDNTEKPSYCKVCRATHGLGDKN